MPTLARASPDRELERLIRLYLRAETDIINEIGRLRSQGLVDYHAVAALERVQAILRQLETQDWQSCSMHHSSSGLGVCTAPCGSAVLCAPPGCQSCARRDGRKASGRVSQC